MSQAVPCGLDPLLQEDPKRQAEAAKICAACPAADACAAEALRLDLARKCGRDRFGVYGCWAGIWLEPDKLPERIELAPWQLA